MRTNYFLIFLVVLLTSYFGEVNAQSDMESAKSVVKIKTSYVEPGKNEKQVGTASGWCWNEPTLVVTALHAVAGIKDQDIMIYKTPTQYCGATVVKVLKEADLALLRLKNDLGLTPLPVVSANPNSGSEYYVWGFPQGVYTIQGDDIRFSRSLESDPTLNSLLTGNKLKDDLKNQGYPLPQAKIFRISSTIQPGHSGAPIFTKDGKVIGIADGGLRGGIARINWAMPAAYYVPRLIASTDNIPNSVSVQTNLYSSNVTVSADASEKEMMEAVINDTKENTISNGTESITKTWTASYQEISEYMDDDDQKDLKKITSYYGLNMNDTQYDIYEDYNTGATFTLPYGKNLYVGNGGVFYSYNDDKSLQYLVYSIQKNTFNEAYTAVDNILQLNYPAGQWHEITANYESWKDDDTHYGFSKTFDNNISWSSDFMTEYNGNNALVVLLTYDKAKIDDPNYLKLCLHYALSKEMSEFARY